MGEADDFYVTESKKNEDEFLEELKKGRRYEDVEKEYIKRAPELVPNALNLILTRTGPESLLNVAVYQNQEDVDSSFKATEDFMAKWEGSIKDAIYLHGPVSLNYSKDRIK